MQLSSFIGQMSQLLSMKMETIERMQRAAEDATKENLPPQQLVSLGAFMSWSIEDINQAISHSAVMLGNLIAPLGIADEALHFDDLFRPDPYSDIREELAVALACTQEQIENLGKLEKKLLALEDGHVLAAYPEKTILDFQSNWEKQFERLLED